MEVNMSDTIFYRGKLKKTCSINDIYEKCLSAIKKSGPTKNWRCTFDEQNQKVVVDFNDSESENMIFELEDRQLNGFCKVFFPMEGDMYEKSSLFFACMKMLYSLKKFFNEFEVSDDYGAWEGFLEAMKYRAKLRELTDEEKERVNKAYEKGYNNHEDMLLMFIAEDLNISVEDNLVDYVSENYAGYERYAIMKEHWMLPVLEMWTCETCTYGKLGRVSDIEEDVKTYLSSFTMSFAAFAMGVEEMFRTCFMLYGLKPDDKRAFGSKHAIVRKMFREKFAPEFNKADSYEKCVLAYRFFVSALEYSGFTFVGKKK